MWKRAPNDKPIELQRNCTRKKYKLHSPWSCLNSAEFTWETKWMRCDAMRWRIMSVCRCWGAFRLHRLQSHGFWLSKCNGLCGGQIEFYIETRQTFDRIWFVSDSSVWLRGNMLQSIVNARNCFCWVCFVCVCFFLVFIIHWDLALPHSIIEIRYCLHLYCFDLKKNGKK